MDSPFLDFSFALKSETDQVACPSLSLFGLILLLAELCRRDGSQGDQPSVGVEKLKQATR